MHDDEREVLRMARDGDGRSFEKLIRPYMDSAFGLAVRILENRAEAEDAVQDALFKAWCALPNFRGDAKFSTWLYRIVWRECVNRTRQRQSLPMEMDLVDRTSSGSPEKSLDRAETKSDIEEALQRLSVPYRAVLIFFYFEDLSVKDIAGIVGSPVSTVKTRLHRARKALGKILYEDEMNERRR